MQWRENADCHECSDDTEQSGLSQTMPKAGLSARWILRFECSLPQLICTPQPQFWTDCKEFAGLSKVTNHKFHFQCKPGLETMVNQLFRIVPWRENAKYVLYFRYNGKLWHAANGESSWHGWEEQECICYLNAQFLSIHLGDAVA